MDGNHLRELRIAAKLTVAGLAARSGIKARAISSWERNERVPTVDRAAKVAAALGVTIDKLMNTED